ncbi:asparagine synthase (glutamine-hydrolyzing) [Microbacterium sp. ARD31]|uniref:asparagine synthase (glutamine-hydrolyzing) n=1 Tax=Microbacterium sp. ARD31 TaxID=2962576 RepID=UPI002881D9A3|nr:asparagine synthase (glutamine-hydrolyzing) [Microbacterium sp. ARD31]MDT0181503.1 asparagine synthase (glutamine-hydrolyzing) [Microbacterium sp. ARD31]
MCGIAGLIDVSQPREARQVQVERMTQALAPRGPDGLRVSSHGPTTFGHTRLAVIDPVGGTQPWTAGLPREESVLVFGGEIYNYRELRATLQGRGHMFLTNSDTEVIARGYREWGTNIFALVRGMFSIAIWDSEHQVLHLARDPLGIKPLYFSHDRSSVQFASEPKALFASGRLGPTLSRSGICELLGMWPYRTPGSPIYDGVDEVCPGEIVTWSPGRVVRSRYWELSAQLNDTTSFDDAVADVRDILEETVRLQLRSDVPLCAAVSGGVDSSSIAAIAQTMFTGSLSSFSLGYVDPTSRFSPTAFRPEPDEPYIDVIVQALGLDHQHLLLTESDIHSRLDDAIRCRDLPSMGDMDASLLLLFERISQERRPVALVGEGADELFGGYPWFRNARDGLTAFPWRNHLSMWSGAITEEFRRTIDLEGYVAESFRAAMERAPVMEGEPEELRTLRSMTFLDLSQFLPGQLERMDRASMANGVEARVPFCDQVLVQYVWQLPTSYKLVGGTEKHLLREAVSGYLPDKIQRRRKASYPTLGGDGHAKYLRDAVMTCLQDDDWWLAEALDAAAIEDALEGRREVQARASVWLGRILSLYRWTKIYDPMVAL